MNHDGHLVIAQALVLNSAPPSYTTSRDTIWPKATDWIDPINEVFESAPTKGILPSF
jgi:hypothetical protein